MSNPAQHATEPEDEESGGLDREHALDLVGFLFPRAATSFAVRGPRPHRRVLVTALVATSVPRVYTVETRILAQRNVVIPLLGNPRRSVPTDSDAPTRAATEDVLRRDNLVAIVDETHLADRWEEGLPRLFRLKNELLRSLGAPVSEEAKKRASSGCSAQARRPHQGWHHQDSGAWHEPEMAYRLVTSAAENFLKDRSAAETAAITEAIGILKEEAARQHDVIESGLSAMEAAAPAAAAPAPSVAAPVVAPRVVLADRNANRG